MVTTDKLAIGMTTGILSFTGKPFALDPAAAKTIKVVVAIKPSATVGKTYTFRLEAYSLNNLDREDLVLAKITAGK